MLPLPQSEQLLDAAADAAMDAYREGAAVGGQVFFRNGRLPLRRVSRLRTGAGKIVLDGSVQRGGYEDGTVMAGLGQPD